MDDIWIVHPKLAAAIDDQAQADRIEISASGLALSASPTSTQLRRACERWWGGNWPNAALGGSGFLGGNELGNATFTISQTTRSSTSHREWVIFSASLTLAQAMTHLSPSLTR